MGSKKHDQGKPDLSILSYEALSEIAKAFEFGANKYGRYNYLEGGFDWTRLASANLRHCYKWIWGEDVDDESGLAHAAHMGATAIMILDHVLKGLGNDNRYKDKK